ncbi:glycosyltransferase [Faunimonas sp. B44]|uniref:glycosyltransferase n=1 Tax=Faunimonas sp. B44 TaxID=3461493 RepID=UPI0040441341
MPRRFAPPPLLRISPRAVILAERLASLRGTSAADELLSARSFRRDAYWRALAGQLGVGFMDSLEGAAPDPAAAPPPSEALRRAEAAMILAEGMPTMVLAPGGESLAALAGHLNLRPELRARVRVAPPEAIRAFLLRTHAHRLLHLATYRLARAMPLCSASRVPSAQGRRDWLWAIFAGGMAGLGAFPAETGLVFSLLLSLAFLNSVTWKLAAACCPPAPEGRSPVPLKDADLPSYSVMVPLYRESAVLPALVRNLEALRYPRSKLQVVLIVEADDMETADALAALVLPPHFEVVKVPPAEPRTKPKALVFALPLARGNCVAVFDAEDRPERDQLRTAAAALAADPRLGCVQASLVPENRDSWFARMFAMEYAANFEVLLPALAHWRVPLPLGGTSNHFPRHILQRVGAWDPFNVTEDADLGIRLARFGYRTGVIRSRTFEEAPVRFSQWLPQRRRRIKGWIQTAVVAMAEGTPKARRLSFRDALAVHAVVTGAILGLLFFPLSFLAAANASYWLLVMEDSLGPVAWMLLGISLWNGFALAAGSAVGAARGLKRAGASGLVRLIPTLPAYWMLMSFAAWQALWQYLTKPFTWEKTQHGVSTSRNAGSPGVA